MRRKIRRKVSESKESQVESGSKEDPEKKTPKKGGNSLGLKKKRRTICCSETPRFKKESAVTQSEISSSKKTKPKKPKAKDEPLPEEPAETPEPIDDESSPNEKANLP